MQHVEKSIRAIADQIESDAGDLYRYAKTLERIRLLPASTTPLADTHAKDLERAVAETAEKVRVALAFLVEGVVPSTVDLSRLDVYPNFVVPDRDVELALKVLRTLRDHCHGDALDADGAVLLSHAHKWIAEAVEQVRWTERLEKAAISPSERGSARSAVVFSSCPHTSMHVPCPHCPPESEVVARARHEGVLADDAKETT